MLTASRVLRMPATSACAGSAIRPGGCHDLWILAGRSRVALPSPLHDGAQDAVDPGRVTLAIPQEPVVNLLIDTSGHQHLRNSAKLRQLLVGQRRDVRIMNAGIVSGSLPLRN